MTRRSGVWADEDSRSSRLDLEYGRDDVELLAETRRRAARTIAAQCDDAATCRELLEMLGLGPADVRAALAGGSISAA